MKNSCQKEQTDNKKSYVFFSDPDIIVKRAEASAVTSGQSQIRQHSEAQQQVLGKQLANLQISTLDIKSLENLLSYHPVQPYPFTFINAVKQKFALTNHPDISIGTHDTNFQGRNNLSSSLLKTDCKQNFYQKMDFIRPLKVPDLRISPKTLDFSNRETSVSKESPTVRSESGAKEFVYDRSDKMIKIGEKVQRKLDFSSSDMSSIPHINCQNIEPLKIPNVSIVSNLNKKKEHIRDNTREKENRSKRLKKDDSVCTKKDESVQDQAKRSRSPRHISKRETIDSINNTIITRHKDDQLPFHAAKNNESVKSKVKTFITSTAKKDNDKRQKSLNIQSIELIKDIPLEAKGRICSNKSLDFLSGKISSDKIMRDNSSIAILSSNFENKFKDNCHLRQMEDLKCKCDSDNRHLKQDKPITIYKEQLKRTFDKNKNLNNKIEGKTHSINSELSEDIECISEINVSQNHTNIYPINSVQPLKSKDPEVITESKQNVNFTKSAKILENCKFTEHSTTHSTSTKQNEESYSQSIITTTQTTTNDDTNDIDISMLPETLFDPTRISFRDNSYSQQEEFCKLTTPDKMDLVIKSKQRKYLTQSDNLEVDKRCSKCKPVVKSEKEQEKIRLMHPTALHMQFQAELRLFDSFNESIRHVDKCLYNTTLEQEAKNLQNESEKDEDIQLGENRTVATVDADIAENIAWKPFDYTKKDVEIWKSNADEAHFSREQYVSNQGNVDELNDNFGNCNKAVIKVAEVQTQTVNDMATQTDKWNIPYMDKWNVQINGLSGIHKRSFSGENEVPQLSLDSAERFEDLDRIEEMSLPSRIRTMSEISLHETTSSIKTETGTEISISTRDVTCSFQSEEFNKYLDLEIAQLIKDEKQRYDRLAMLFKSREKTLNDKTKKLAQLEEQKRALKDTGQDSRVSSVKKKQRALLLKLQQEKDEMTRLKELHKIASQERKLMLQKQRDMFNPQMSTKNILTKLKRSADSQSPRRLSGPMKGYDIRSNSSISSLIDSDKSQQDRSQTDTHLQTPESDIHLSKFDLAKSDKCMNLAEESNTSLTKFDDLVDRLVENNELQGNGCIKLQKKSDTPKYELKSQKYEEKMPILRLKQSQLDIESKQIQCRPMELKRLLQKQRPIEVSQSLKQETNSSVPDYVKSESDTLVEELSKRSRTSQKVNPSVQIATTLNEKELSSNVVTANSEEEINFETQVSLKPTKSSQVSEDILQTYINKGSKNMNKSIMIERNISKKLEHDVELKANSKRRSSKYQKTRSSSDILMENILQPKSSSHLSEELIKYPDKRTRVENELVQLDNNIVLAELDLNESQSSLQALVRHSKDVKDKNSKLLNEINDYESKENIADQASNRKLENVDGLFRNERATENISMSQINTFAVSHHSSEESENNFSKSIVVRSQDRDFKASKKFEQILTARETALASRKNCIEEWVAWHTRLRAEEERVTRMEQAALKLVAATSNVLSQQDTTVSSDTSDVEGRISILTEKLAKRRVEMSRLKREARKQTKQKLRALEASLLNQIKRYDTTIHEMRKKLESKRAIKDNDKLAIEPKSLADFKVPEIPLKRIQDVYKNSDLLRCRSESDLLETKDQQKIVTPVTYSDRYEKDDSQKSIKTTDIKSINSELRNATGTDSIQSIFDECKSNVQTPDKSQTVTSNDVHYKMYSVSAPDAHKRQFSEEYAEMKQNSVLHDAKDVETVKSELETMSSTIVSFEDTTNTEPTSSNNRSQAKTHTTESEISEEVEDDYSKSVPSESDCPTESAAHITPAVASGENIFSFSKKLDFLQLNNKNLNEDINSLENGLKVLSEMMSRFSNQTNKKSKAGSDEKSTSQDVSEIISKSIFSDGVNDVGNEEKKTILSEREIDIESLSVSMNEKKSKSSNDLSHNKYMSETIHSEISPIISEKAPALSNLVPEIDYEARSKEILNEIEKSIISEHTKVAHGDYVVSSILENDMQNLHKENEELLKDLVSLEFDIESISQSRKNLDLETNTTMQILDDSKKDLNARDDLNEIKLEKEVQVTVMRSPKLSKPSSVESTHSPIIAGHRSKENYETNSQVDVQSARSTISSKTSRVFNSEKSSENIPEVLEEFETSIIDDPEILETNLERDEDIRTALLDNTIHSTLLASVTDQNRSRIISAKNSSLDRDDWTTSDSFHIPQNEISVDEAEELDGENAESENSRSLRTHGPSNNFLGKKDVSRVDDMTNQEVGMDLVSEVNTSSVIPKGESTKAEISDTTFNNVLEEFRTVRNNDQLNDTSNIINAGEDNRKESISENNSEKFDDIIYDSVVELLDKVENIVANNGKSTDNHLARIICDDEIDVPADNRSETIFMSSNEMQNKINVGHTNEKHDAISANTCNDDNKSINREKLIDDSLRVVDETDDESAKSLCAEIAKDEDSPREAISEAQGIIITELDSDNTEDYVLSELEIEAKVELAEDEEEFADASEKESRYAAERNKNVSAEIQECLELISEHESSDGEQRDNLVEIAESGLDTVEKFVISLRVVPTKSEDEKFSTRTEETREKTTDNSHVSRNEKIDEATTSDASIIASNINKTFDILKDPDYEDISEESLEVSEILDKNELPKAVIARKPVDPSEKYRATSAKSEEVLKILDEIVQKSLSESNPRRDERDAHSAESPTEDISELLGAEVSVDDVLTPETNRTTDKDTDIWEKFYKADDSGSDQFAEVVVKQSVGTNNDAGLIEEKSGELSLKLNEGSRDDHSSQIIYDLRERVSLLQEQDGSSESSEAGDTPRGVPEIEMDSPRDFNNSRLDIDVLDDDLLSGTKAADQSVDTKTNFHSASIVATSEKDIEAMIEKLKASLEQPGLDVAELEAKLLRIEQLQIELEIKKLEAEEVSYYVREIPNKPPPPYTPPGDGRLSASLGSPSLLSAVIPSNVEELTLFTEKATTLIYNAKLAGEDIAVLEVPLEIYELNKGKNETLKRDRRIYNTFLFDLCKETVAEIYRAEYEKPGPSWTKPNVKTKPTMKIPKTVEELTEYVSKEVATLFGFKTKLQRENMVMRWSRKRRDRVDELLAREAQAEEDEWTKFHHDELAVKNGLTVAILDTVVMETANAMKVAYGKKRRIMV